MHFDPFRGNGGGEDLWQSAANIVKSVRLHSQEMLDTNDKMLRRDHTVPLDPASAADVTLLSVAAAFGLQHVMVSHICNMIERMIEQRDPTVLRMIALLVNEAWDAAKLGTLLPPNYKKR